ncbi:hypothetical protein [Prosthecobacter fluviatilis]|uniref:Uncharacterized protein n=1 Tax=Prosthecobacter fluviatilis TaxID=445931 RepID=A0ABW0KRH9_9BACT
MSRWLQARTFPNSPHSKLFGESGYGMAQSPIANPSSHLAHAPAAKDQERGDYQQFSSNQHPAGWRLKHAPWE